MKRACYILAAVLFTIVAACTKYQIPAPECPEGRSGMSFSNDIQPIFNNKCVSCHAGNQPPDLSDGWSYEELMDGDYVSEAEFACESSLYQVFSGTHSGRVTEEELLEILGWIQEGAKDN